MPLYEYQCLECGKKTEVLQRFSDAPLAACPNCGGGVRKLFSAPAVQFKGSGFYVTDYGAKKPGSAAGTSEGASETKSEAKSESKSESKAESKSESKSESKTESKSEKSSTESKSAPAKSD